MASHQPPPSASFSSKLDAWRSTPDVFTAADLISEAAITGHSDDAVRSAADAIAASDLPDFTKRVAELASGRAYGTFGEVSAGIAAEDFYERIRRLKRLVVSDPRNAIAWTDLSLAYTSLGQTQAAAQALTNALGTARDNRFVLRGAVRFWVHHREPDHALNLLRASPLTPKDPWLLAAESAVSELAERPTQFAKIGRRLLEAETFNDFNLSELATALASQELAAGSVSRARKLFRRSLVNPTENAVAQVAWAEYAAGLDILTESHLLIARSYEARARDAAHAGDWSRSVVESEQWIHDQPFSVQAWAFASYAASVGLGNYSLGAQFARSGLRANRANTLLRNNLAFCLASGSDAEGALRELKKISAAEIESDGVLLATSGLVEFRRGNLLQGRALYARAVDYFDQRQLPKSKAMAAIYLAREERIARTDQAVAALSEARRLAAARNEPEVIATLRAVEVLHADAGRGSL